MYKRLLSVVAIFSLLFSMFFNVINVQEIHAATGISVSSISANVGDMLAKPTFTITGANLPTLTGGITQYVSYGGTDYQNFGMREETSPGLSFGDSRDFDVEGINVISSSSTQLVFQMGGTYGGHYTGTIDFYLAPSTSYVQENSSYFVGSINLSTVQPIMTVSSITANVGDMLAKPTFTITGANLPTLTGGTTQYVSYGGTDYQNFGMLEESSPGLSFGDSRDFDVEGINVISSSSTQLVFQMGGTYGGHYTGTIDFYLAPSTSYVQENSSSYVGSINLNSLTTGLSGSGAVTQIQTLDPNETDLQSMDADPINTATGAQEISRNLITIYGEQPLSFQLRYNSLLLKQGTMGNGWGHNFEIHLESLSNGNVVIHWTANRQNTFIKKSSGQFWGQDFSTRYDSLIQKSDGSYVLTRRDLSVYQFNSNGQLVQQSNGHGQTYTLSYDSTGRLLQVIEPVSGQSLNFNYNTNGLISSVSDNANRMALFTYDSNNNLTSITDPNGNKTTVSAQ